MHDLVTRLDARAELRLVPYAFERAYGYAPSAVWTAPYPVRLGGQPLTVAVHWQVVVAASPRADGVIRMASLNRPAEWIETSVAGPPAEVPEWVRYPYEVLRRGASDGLDVLVHVDLPVTSGLSADLPLACAVALADAELHEDWRARGRVADLVPGRPDEIGAVLWGEPGHAVNADGDLVPVDLAEAALKMMLIVTRPVASHDTAAEAALAVQRAVTGGAVSAWQVGPAAVAIVAAEAQPALRASVADHFRDQELRAPRFLTLRSAGSACRHDA